MLEKINKLTNWQAALIIAIVGFAVYATGLTNPFQGDDTLQIVNSIPVHSITNIRLFFEGGTFYNGQGLAPLIGTYYRPLMTTVFSLLYSLFGPHTFNFHLTQLLLCIGSTVLLYLFFRYFFKPSLALFLSLVFLVHPIDSQVVFAIPSMQDALFFFFGILALWLLVRFRTIGSIPVVAVCLLLSLLAKETGVLFIAVALLYLFWFDRKKRLYAFIVTMILPLGLYLALRLHAIGLIGRADIVPIDKLSLAGRLLTAPSTLAFYMTKFLFPWKLATAYYWVYPVFSVRHVLLPFIFDLAVAGVVVFVAIMLRKRTSKAMFYSYLFFTTWFALGLLLVTQIIPLDMTACETWFYFSMVGALGMIGLVVTVYSPQMRHRWLLVVIGASILIVLGSRTAARGLDWRNQYVLAYKDIAASKEDYNAYETIAAHFVQQGNYREAEIYAKRSISICPTFGNYNTLGVTSGLLGDYAGAYNAYTRSLSLDGSSYVFENLAELTLVYGDFDANKQLVSNALERYPNDSKLWLYLALLEDANNDNVDARSAISNAARYGQVPQFIYDGIMNNRSFYVIAPDLGRTLVIKK